MLNICLLAEFLTNFADSGQVALAESSDQGLQCLSIYYTNRLSLKCLLELAVPNLPNMYVLAKFLTNIADAGYVALAELPDQGLQCLPIYYINLLHLECLLTVSVPNLPKRECTTKFLTNFADSGHVALVEKPDQDLQSSPTFWLYILCYGYFKFIVLDLSY